MLMPISLVLEEVESKLIHDGRESQLEDLRMRTSVTKKSKESAALLKSKF